MNFPVTEICELVNPNKGPTSDAATAFGCFSPQCSSSSAEKTLLFVFFTSGMKEITTFLFPISSCDSLLSLQIQSVGLMINPFTSLLWQITNTMFDTILGWKERKSMQICDKADSLGAIVSLITLIQTHSTSRLHGNRLILFPFSAHSAGTPCFTHFQSLVQS